MNPDNNRWDNLRQANASQNGYNMRLKSNNSTGYRGVTPYFHGPGYVAQITVNKIAIHIGRYETAKEAAIARDEYAKKHHGEFARTQS